MGRKFVDLTGQCFGILTVIRKTDKNKFGQSRWVCRCTCGNEITTVGNRLIQGGVKSCGCIKFTKDLSGQKFGSLTVLNQSKTANQKNTGKHIFWLCQCVCGIKKVIRGDSLKNGEVVSCGCLHPRKPHSDPESARMSSARNVYRNTYMDGDLSFEDFNDLSQLPCYYCGALPSNRENVFLRHQSTDFAKRNGLFIYNGLDRVDSNYAHDKDNVVPCCYPCNWSKSSRSVDDFEIWIVKLAINLCSRDKSKYQEIIESVDGNMVV